MSAWECPKCGERLPEHTSWAGGGKVLIIGCHCKKCGYRWNSKSKVGGKA